MGETRFKDINFVLDSSPDETEQKYLTFWTDGQLFAIPILNVEQIAGIQEITSVPDYPDYLKGITKDAWYGDSGSGFQTAHGKIRNSLS